MNTRLWLSLALLSSCGPLPAALTQDPLGTGKPLTSGPEADAGAPVPDAGAGKSDAGQQQLADAGPALTGLPCDVQAVLQHNCAGCHTGTTSAPILNTREKFLALAQTGELTVGKLASQRMSPGAMAPMPPYGANPQPTPAEVGTVTGWVQAGMPGGACGGLTQPH